LVQPHVWGISLPTHWLNPMVGAFPKLGSSVQPLILEMFTFMGTRFRVYGKAHGKGCCEIKHT